MPCPVKKSELSEKHRIREKINSHLRVIDTANRKIDEIAKEAIPEFHFLNHKVSDFWDCEKSPIGKCVWDISKNGFNINCQCYYCKSPVERK